VVDVANDRILSSNIPPFAGIDITRSLQAELGRPVAMANDAPLGADPLIAVENVAVDGNPPTDPAAEDHAQHHRQIFCRAETRLG
jgi:hypothetical protein